MCHDFLESSGRMYGWLGSLPDARSVPDEYKPLVFKDGVRQPFPCPTRKATQEVPTLFDAGEATAQVR